MIFFWHCQAFVAPVTGAIFWAMPFIYTSFRFASEESRHGKTVCQWLWAVFRERPTHANASSAIPLFVCYKKELRAKGRNLTWSKFFGIAAGYLLRRPRRWAFRTTLD